MIVAIENGSAMAFNSHNSGLEIDFQPAEIHHPLHHLRPMISEVERKL